MNTKMSVFMISFSLVAGIAQAADIEGTSRTSATRAQVIAGAQGLLSRGELDYPPALPVSSSKTRQEVAAELAATRAAGQLSHGELDYPPASQDHSYRTRVEVQAELVAARESGELPRVEY